MKETKIPIFYCFARSGGTLLNRCLGCIERNLVLSEVNPHQSVYSVEEQAVNWLKLISEAELTEFSNKPYTEKISILVEKAKQQSKYLIIRDWTTLNFFHEACGDPRSIYNKTYVSSMVLEQSIYFSYSGLNLEPIAMVRRSSDVYESMQRSFKHLKNLSVDKFAQHYLAYAKAVSNYPIFYYENFCQEPQKELHRICNLLDVNYDPSFITEFSKFTNCTGDNTLSTQSRGIQLQKIRPLESNVSSEIYLAASQNKMCQEADRILGYDNGKLTS